MNLKYFAFGLVFYLHYQIIQCNSESITYFSTERPVIHWYDKKYFKHFTVLSKRLNRRDPRHYVEVHTHTLFTVNSNLKSDFYFYQFLTNRYQPSFVEMHFKFCDMINSDTFFGQTTRNALGGAPCPYPPGVYHLKNMSVPYVPKGFPFTKGRVYCNASVNTAGVTKIIGSGSIDIEIKVAKISKN